MQADYTLRRLEQLKEQILSTEGLVAIKLDSRRNELVALNLVCTNAFACLHHLHSTVVMLCNTPVWKPGRDAVQYACMKSLYNGLFVSVLLLLSCVKVWCNGT